MVAEDRIYGVGYCDLSEGERKRLESIIARAVKGTSAMSKAKETNELQKVRKHRSAMLIEFQ